MRPSRSVTVTTNIPINLLWVFPALIISAAILSFSVWVGANDSVAAVGRGGIELANSEEPYFRSATTDGGIVVPTISETGQDAYPTTGRRFAKRMRSPISHRAFQDSVSWNQRETV